MKHWEPVIAITAITWSLIVETLLPGTLGDILTAGASTSWFWWDMALGAVL